jgi:hypothetical protein
MVNSLRAVKRVKIFDWCRSIYTKILLLVRPILDNIDLDDQLYTLQGGAQAVIAEVSISLEVSIPL